jgi:hypothetical protein
MNNLWRKSEQQQSNFGHMEIASLGSLQSIATTNIAEKSYSKVGNTLAY